MNQDKLNELNSLTIEELESLITASSKEIALKKSKDANTVSAKVSELLQEEVCEHTEMHPPKITPKVAPQKLLASNIKYQDPNNPARTWTGRGRMPLWMMEAIRAGADKESFIIKD